MTAPNGWDTRGSTDDAGRRAAAALGVAGPGAFTAAWLVAGALDDGYSHQREYISGLAAEGAGAAPVMIAGFLIGGAAIALLGVAVMRGVARGRALGGLLLLVGVALAIDGVLRQDCSTALATCKPASWHSQAHDGLSLLIFVALAATPFVASRAAARDDRLRPLRAAGLGTGVAGLVLLGLVAAEPWPASAGSVQRALVLLLLGFVAAIGLVVARGGGAADPHGRLRTGAREASMLR